MRKGCAGRRLARFKTSSKWLVSSVFATAVMSGQACAKEATDNITTMLSPDSITQQDKTGGDWTEVISNVPSGFTTLITARPNILMEQDRHTVALSATLLPDTAYAASYYVMVKNASAGARRDGVGLIRTPEGVAITTVLPNVPFSLPVAPALTALMRLGNATDLAKTGARSEISRASNSFLEQLPVPELGTMELMVTGILALAGAVRRRRNPGHP